jgi:hypothetical protein
MSTYATSSLRWTTSRGLPTVAHAFACGRRERRLVRRNFASGNQLDGWLRPDRGAPRCGLSDRPAHSLPAEPARAAHRHRSDGQYQVVARSETCRPYPCRSGVRYSWQLLRGRDSLRAEAGSCLNSGSGTPTPHVGPSVSIGVASPLSPFSPSDAGTMAETATSVRFERAGSGVWPPASRCRHDWRRRPPFQSAFRAPESAASWRDRDPGT